MLYKDVTVEIWPTNKHFEECFSPATRKHKYVDSSFDGRAIFRLVMIINMCMYVRYKLHFMVLSS